MTDRAIDRRTLLGLFAGTGLALLVGCSESDDQQAVCDALGDGLPGVVAIGIRYRELAPDDDLDLGGPDPGGPDLGGEVTPASLRDRVRRDFENGDVVDVDGWVLARTEARAAAILAGC